MNRDMDYIGKPRLMVNGKPMAIVSSIDCSIKAGEVSDMDSTVEEALDHDVQTKKMQITVEVPESKRNGDLESEVVSSVPAIKRALSTEPLCPTCGDPYESRGRVGWNHPIDIDDDLGRVCMGENGKNHSGHGGLTWMYNHTNEQV